jgi:cell division protein FtsN
MHKRSFRQRGSMLLGFIIGLVVGLAIAVAVALYISNAPLPFVTKVRPPTTGATAPAGATTDPNKSFNISPPGPIPPPDPKLPGTSPSTVPPPTTAAAPSSLPPAAAPAEPAKEDALPEGSRFLLQAGAFKSPEDADGMRARLALIGLDARIFPIEQSGQTLYRVRLGPYGQLDDVNRVRKLLAENSIEAQIVRLR